MNIGEQLSHYIIEDKIGDGGFGDVFRARDINTGVDVGIKCSRPGDTNQLPDQQQRFLREVSCSSKLCHPNIVQVYEYGALPDGTLYLVMEFVNGINLENAIKQNAPLSYSYSVKVITQVLSALGEAHNQSIIHRDLKPANIMLIHEGYDCDTVKLLDFGIAKAFDGTQPDLTKQFFQNSVGFGTPQYMPPEQFFGKNLGPHSDIYAIGLVFFEMLTGKQAFAGKNLSDVIQRQLKEFPEIPKPYCEGPLFDVFRKAIAKDVSMRYANAQEMINDLKDIETRYKAWFDVYDKVSSNVPVFPATNETSINLSEYSSEDISAFNTAIFKTPEDEVGATSSQGTVVYDEFAEDDNAPTDDMSRLNLPLPPSMAHPELYPRRPVSDDADATVNLDQPVIEDISSANTLMFCTGSEDEMNEYMKTNDAGIVNPHQVQNCQVSASYRQPTIEAPRLPANCLNRRVGEDEDPPPVFHSQKTKFLQNHQISRMDRNAEWHPQTQDEEPPPVFHEQKTKFLSSRMIGRSMRSTRLGEMAWFERIMLSEPVTRLVESPVGRAAGAFKRKFNQIIDELYEWHFGALVACICLLIVILAAVVLIIVIGKN